MEIGRQNISFGSKYLVKGNDIDLQNPDHLISLGYSIAMADNELELLCKMNAKNHIDKNNYVFDIDDSRNFEFEDLLDEVGLKFNKLA